MTRCLPDEVLLDLVAGRPAAAPAHLAQCPSCRARLAALRDDLGLLRSALLEGPLPEPRRRTRRAWLPAAAATAAAAVALVIALRPGDSGAPAPAPSAVSYAFAHEVDAALFPDSADTTAGDTLDDAGVLVAALNGGSACADPFGCTAAALYGWND